MKQSYWNNYKTIKQNKQAPDNCGNGVMRVKARAWRITNDTYDGDGGWGDDGKTFGVFLIAQDRQMANARNHIFAGRTAKKNNKSTTAITPTISEANIHTTSEDSTGDDDGGGDSDPDPDCPPIHLFNPHQLTSNTKKQQNSFYFSWRLASCQWLMAQGVA